MHTKRFTREILAVSPDSRSFTNRPRQARKLTEHLCRAESPDLKMLSPTTFERNDHVRVFSFVNSIKSVGVVDETCGETIDF